jgi:hypothetical protein
MSIPLVVATIVLVLVVAIVSFFIAISRRRSFESPFDTILDTTFGLVVIVYLFMSGVYSSTKATKTPGVVRLGQLVIGGLAICIVMYWFLHRH